MFKRIIRVLILVLVLALLLPVLAQDDEVVVVEPDEPVRIGFATNLSLEAVIAFGIDIQRGGEMAVMDRPTVTVGDQEFEVELDIQDSQCSAEGGQPVANRFTSDESIVAVVGHMCSSSTEAGIPIYDAAGFTIISPSSTANALTERGFTSFNRVAPPDKFQGSLVAEFIFNQLGIERIATIHDGSTYGEGLVNDVTGRFEELGGEIVAADAINVGDTDFRALLEDVATEEPALIYFAGFIAEGSRLIQQLPDAGLEDVPFMGADGIQGAELIEQAGEAANGVYASAPVPVSGEAYDAFLEAYQEMYEEAPPSPYHSNAYDAVNILLNAVEAVGEIDDDGNLVVSRTAVAEYVRSFEEYEGLTGVFRPDGTGEMFLGGYGIFQVQDGEWVRLETAEVEEEAE